MPQRKGKKLEFNPNLAPQDRGGFISPNLANLRRLREEGNITRDQINQLNAIESRRFRENPPVQVDTPLMIQPHGKPQHAYRNNNPGNLTFRGQTQAERATDSKFAKFPTPEIGFTALEQQVRRYQASGFTLAEMISTYAPAFENDTERYIEQASKYLNVSPNTPANQINTRELSIFLARKESGSRVRSYNPFSDSPQVRTFPVIPK